MIYFQLKYPEKKEQKKTSWLPMQCFQLEKNKSIHWRDWSMQDKKEMYLGYRMLSNFSSYIEF